MALLMASVSSATFAGDIDDLFSGGEDEFQFERFSDESVLLKIDADAQIACNAGVCTLHTVTNRYGEFEVSFNVGEGDTDSNNSGTTIITGGGAQDGYQTINQNEQYWGATVSYKKGACTQSINVPRSVYYSINRYMYGLMTDEGGTRRGFTPADEAMIMFYTTIMDKANGCMPN